MKSMKTPTTIAAVPRSRIVRRVTATEGCDCLGQVTSDPHATCENDRADTDVAGQPTRLVRDGGIENYDPQPAGQPKVKLVETRHTDSSDGTDLRRADDRSAGAAYDPGARVWGPIDILAMTSRPPPEAPPNESESWLDGREPRRS